MFYTCMSFVLVQKNSIKQVIISWVMHIFVNSHVVLSHVGTKISTCIFIIASKNHIYVLQV